LIAVAPTGRTLENEVFRLHELGPDGDPVRSLSYTWSVGGNGLAPLRGIEGDLIFPANERPDVQVPHLASTADGGYAVAFTSMGIVSLQRATDAETGDLIDLPHGQANITVTKLDAKLRVEWVRVYGGAQQDGVFGLESLPDGGLLVSGWSESMGPRSEGWLLRLGPDGTVAEGCQALLMELGAGAFRRFEAPQLEPIDDANIEWLKGAAPEPESVEGPTQRDVEPDLRVAAQCRGMVPRQDDASESPGRAPQHTLTLRQAGSLERVVTSIPSGILCGTTANSLCRADFAAGSLVRLVIDPAARVDFSGWGPGCEAADSDECTVRLDEDRTIEVYFGSRPPPEVTLRVSKQGVGSGRVISGPAGIDCGDDCEATFARNTRVTLSALPGAGSRFAGWVGDPDCADGELELTRDVECTAQFDSAGGDPMRIRVGHTGLGSGRISSTPAGIDCGGTCDAEFPSGTVVQLTATPDPGSTFGGWLGGPDCADGVISDGKRFTECTARFEQGSGSGFTLRVDVDGGPMSNVRSGDGRIDCPGQCVAQYRAGARVTLSANNGPGESVGGWTKDCGAFGQQTGISLTMDADKECGVYFE